MRKVVLLVSGKGGHLKYLYKSLEILQLPIEIVAVIADRDCGAFDFAVEKGITARKVKYLRSEPLDLRQRLLTFEPDIIITNIHKLIDAETLELFPNRFINLHYSLLPAFAGMIGMKTLEEAKKQNVQFIGATCHYVNEEMDAGTVISQAYFAGDWRRPMNELVEITFRSACMILINALVKVLRINVEEESSVVKIEQTEVFFNPPLSFDAPKLFAGLWPNNNFSCK